MTAKEKALEIFNRYHNLDIEPYSEFGNFMCKDSAKQCALISVDEMLSLGLMVGNNLSDSFYIYWREVKQEIKLL